MKIGFKKNLALTLALFLVVGLMSDFFLTANAAGDSSVTIGGTTLALGKCYFVSGGDIVTDDPAPANNPDGFDSNNRFVWYQQQGDNTVLQMNNADLNKADVRVENVKIQLMGTSKVKKLDVYGENTLEAISGGSLTVGASGMTGAQDANITFSNATGAALIADSNSFTIYEPGGTTLSSTIADGTTIDYLNIEGTMKWVVRPEDNGDPAPGQYMFVFNPEPNAQYTAGQVWEVAGNGTRTERYHGDRINFTAGTPLTFALEPANGDIGDVHVDLDPMTANVDPSPLTIANGQITFTPEDGKCYKIFVFWPEQNNGDPSEPDRGPEAFMAAKRYIENWILAYYSATNDPDELKNYMTTELWNEGFSEFNGHHGDFEGMFTNKAAFVAATEVTGALQNDGIAGLKYYNYKITLPNGLEAGGNVHVMENATDIGVKVGDEIRIVDGAGGSDKYLRTQNSPVDNDVTVFGNGICIEGKLDGGSDNVWTAHIGQGHSGLSIGNIGFRLVIVQQGVTPVKITSSVSAAAWDFQKVDIFETSADSSAPAIAEIYYGNDGSAGKEVVIAQSSGIPGEVQVASVAVDTSKLSGAAASIVKDGTDFKLVSNSNYDVIPLIVTYSDGSVGYVEVRRLGLYVKDQNVGGGKVTVMHGSDDDDDIYAVSAGSQKCVTASFYYNTGATKPAAADHVTLFVTIETTSGVETKVVTRLNNDFAQANQGNDKYVDDFLLWEGSNTEFDDQLISISAIVYNPGDEDSFGGVRIGSGTGVEWRK